MARARVGPCAVGVETGWVTRWDTHPGLVLRVTQIAVAFIGL